MPKGFDRKLEFADPYRGDCGMPISCAGAIAEICKTSQQTAGASNRDGLQERCLIGPSKKHFSPGAPVFAFGFARQAGVPAGMYKEPGRTQALPV